MEALKRAGVELRANLELAESSYEKVLQMNPRSVPMLRSYAQFLADWRATRSVLRSTVDRADKLETAAELSARVTVVKDFAVFAAAAGRSCPVG